MTTTSLRTGPARAWMLTLAAWGAAGCSVGPDYQRPELSDDVPQGWHTESRSEGADTSQELADWWRHLDDPELTALVERAFTGSLGLAEARERIASARARRGIDNADRLPTLDARASYERLSTGDDAFIVGGAPPGVDTDVYALGAIAGWELDLWGRVGRLVEAADADIEFAIEDYRASRVALAAEVAREVVLIRAIDRERAIVDATVLTDLDSLSIARARADAGFSDELNASRAQRVLESNLASVPELEARRRSAEYRLAALLGVAPGAVAVESEGLPRRDVLPSLGVPADLLLRRPDLRRAERALAAATARIGAAQAERYPRVALAGSITLQGPQLGDAVNPDAYLLSLGPSISLPIFEGGRIRSRVQQAESAERQALLALRRGVLEALQEVETAAVRRQRTEERASRLASAEVAARQTEALALDRFQAGAVDFLDVTEARTQRLLIERERLLAERDATLRLIDLYAALGGGWDHPDRRTASGG